MSTEHPMESGKTIKPLQLEHIFIRLILLEASNLHQWTL